jgi:hypothetical protein
MYTVRLTVQSPDRKVEDQIVYVAAASPLDARITAIDRFATLHPEYRVIAMQAVRIA